MTIGEAFQKLNIEDYAERIFNSNSHGELFYLWDYVAVVQVHEAAGVDLAWFRPWFVDVVKWAEKNWQRPESVFQHLPRLLQDYVSR